jgi:hypothetical protein
MASGFYLIVFRRFSSSFTGIIGRVVGFGGGDSTADDNFTRVANIYVEVTPHCSVAVGLVGRHLSIICVLSFASHQLLYDMTICA